MLSAPRTDPYVQHYRIRLLPWMNGVKAFFWDASRTRCNPVDGVSRLSVLAPAVCPAFSLVNCLLSKASAGCLPLFNFFFDTTQLSDFLEMCMLGVWFVALPNRSGFSILPDISRISRFPCKECLRISIASDDGFHKHPTVDFNRIRWCISLLSDGRFQSTRWS